MLDVEIYGVTKVGVVRTRVSVDGKAKET